MNKEMYGLNLKYSQNSPFVEGLVPVASSVQSWAFARWLDHKSSSLMD